MQPYRVPVYCGLVQLPGPQFHLQWVPPLQIVGLLFAFLIFVDLAVELLYLATGISHGTIEVYVLPFLEEMLKLWLLLKLSEKALRAIITFGVMELIFVKGPVLIVASGFGEALVLTATASIVLGFHVVTAFAYRWTVGSGHTWFIFGVCAACHFLFNFLSTFDLSFGVWVLGVFSVSAIVVAIGRLSAWISSPIQKH